MSCRPVDQVSEVFSIEFVSPEGEELRFDWEADALAGFDPQNPDPPVWELAGELDWDEIARISVFSGRLDDRRRLVIAAIRPASAEGHGEEAITGLAIEPDETVDQFEEVLLSSERGADGTLLRVGLELYSGGSGIPLRIAADPSGHASRHDGRLVHELTALDLRTHGATGVATLEVLRRG